MSSLADLLAKPSVESWKAIVEIGKRPTHSVMLRQAMFSWAPYATAYRTGPRD